MQHKKAQVKSPECLPVKGFVELNFLQENFKE